MDYLNITSRQMCEKVSAAMSKMSADAQRALAFAAKLGTSDIQNINFDDLIDYGILNTNKSVHNFACFTPEELSAGGSSIISKRVMLWEDNITYNQSVSVTILDFLESVNSPDLVSYFGTPVMNTINAEGHYTIKDYIRANYQDYGDESVDFDIKITIGDVEQTVCHVHVGTDNAVTVTNYNESLIETQFFSLFLGSLTAVSCGTTMLVELMSALADGVTSSSDIFSVLNKYVNSPISSVAGFAQSIIQNGNSSAQMAISKITQLFRDTFGDYNENNDGTITWTITGSKMVSTFFQVVVNIATSVGQVLGMVLLYGGTVIGKIVGGVLTLASSAIKAVTTTLGQITGTTPYINDEAIDHCYHDPIAQGTNTIYEQYIDDLILDELKVSKRCKIVIPCGVLYLYNYKYVSATQVQIEWKLFPGMDSPAPYLDLMNDRISGTNHVVWSQGNVSMSLSYTGTSYSNTKYAFTTRSKIWEDRYIGNAPYSQQFDAGLNLWKRNHFRASSNNPSLSLSANSADAAYWTGFWYTLCTNAISCLALVFCNPRFYTSNYNHCISSFDTSDYDLRPLFFYGYQYTYTSVVSCVANLANKDHSGDRFFIALLETLGFYTIPGTNVSVYSYTVRAVHQPGDLPQITWSESMSNIPVRQREYLEDYTGIFTMLSVDKYSYATPPSYDLKSILWGAIAVAAAVAVVITAVQVARTVIRRKVSLYMQRKGQQLLSDGEVFRNGFTQEEYLELSPEDRRTYMNAWKSYNLKVKLYNFVANALHLGTIDWMNNWWNEYQTVMPPIIGQTDDANFADNINASANAITVIDGMVTGNTTPILEQTSDAVNNTNRIVRLITGSNPNNRLSFDKTRDR